jgi:hypothetical protein
VEWRLENGRAN